MVRQSTRLLKSVGASRHEQSLATHVEVKLAVRMRQEKRLNETVIIDRQVCGRRPHDMHLSVTCDKRLKNILSPGSTLTVIERDGTRVTYRGAR
ncbi:DddA-like double-stranded DNA deaminase toxin [Saccharothrix isguenensis]